VRALGIDVGVRKGLDLVLMDEDRSILECLRRVHVEEIAVVVGDLGPDAVAIDAPHAWARSGRSRVTERELRWFGIQCFNTPSDHRMAEHPFYEWMTVGFAIFAAIADSFPRYLTGTVVKGTAFEVFPHATAVVLAGAPPPVGVRPHVWRREVLSAHDVDPTGLRSNDQVDAALAALTGIYALERRFSAPGDPREGRIVVPAVTLPAQPYRRARAADRPDEQPALPGMSPCRCGDPTCTAMTAREFAPGHDAKRKSALWALARSGQDALDELRRRRWAIPPEMR
jgi:predicted nuclease with RNAse H fold